MTKESRFYQQMFSYVVISLPFVLAIIEVYIGSALALLVLIIYLRNFDWPIKQRDQSKYYYWVVFSYVFITCIVAANLFYYPEERGLPALIWMFSFCLYFLFDHNIANQRNDTYKYE